MIPFKIAPLKLAQSLAAGVWGCRLGGQQGDSTLPYCVSPWEKHAETDAVCNCQAGYDLRRGASSQQMVGEIKSVTQNVTMELRNRGSRYTCTSFVCACVCLCEDVCAQVYICVQVPALPETATKPVLLWVNSQFHSPHHFHKQPAVCNVKQDLTTPLSSTTMGNGHYRNPPAFRERMTESVKVMWKGKGIAVTQQTLFWSL